MTPSDTALDGAFQKLVAAIDGEPPGEEAAYLARLALLLLDHAHYASGALALIDVAGSDTSARNRA